VPETARHGRPTRGVDLRKLKEWRKLKGKRYQVPLEGARVFIRVWQQLNGWENEAGMFCGSAIVPGKGQRKLAAAAGGGKAGHQ
jgi:hypothetical protein